MESDGAGSAVKPQLRNTSGISMHFLNGFRRGKRVDKPVTIAYKQSLLERGYASSSINSMVAALNSFFSSQ